VTSAFDNPTDMMVGINNVGTGWHQLIKDLEEKLNAIDPNFELLQVKEKFGSLRYYTSFTAVDGQARFDALISIAEETSDHICEVCGQPGENTPTRGWYKTLCTEHRAQREAS
jgi:hypothetical protein